MHLEFTIEGEKEISAVLGIVDRGVQDFHKPLDQTRRRIMQDVEANFASRGALMGGWKPRRYERPWPLLEQTGAMRRGFVSAVTNTQVAIGNLADHFKYHQSKKPRRVIPRRVMLMILPPTRVDIFKYFQVHLADLLKARTR